MLGYAVLCYVRLCLCVCLYLRYVRSGSVMLCYAM